MFVCLSVRPSLRRNLVLYRNNWGGLIPTCSVAPFFCCDLIPTWQITVVQNYDIVNSLRWSKIGDLTSPNIHQNQLFRSSAVDPLQHFPNPSRPSIAGGRGFAARSDLAVHFPKNSTPCSRSSGLGIRSFGPCCGESLLFKVGKVQ